MGNRHRSWFYVRFSLFFGYFPAYSFFPGGGCAGEMDHKRILETNRQVYDAMAAANDPLCRPAKDEELANPLATVDAAGWLGESIAGQNLLCLAAGGGRQSSLYAAAGANVTVVDLSGAMLELDREVASQRGYSLRLFEASMESLPMLSDGEFDIVIHPVSTCYVPQVAPVFQEVARVMRPGGIYISQHKQPTSLQSSIDPLAEGGYSVSHSYYRDTPVPPTTSNLSAGRRLREQGAIEFVHRWEQLIGGMCRAGFVIEDLTEPMHARRNETTTPGSFADRARYLPPYVRVKARRVGKAANVGTLWLPSTTG